MEWDILRKIPHTGVPGGNVDAIFFPVNKEKLKLQETSRCA